MSGFIRIVLIACLVAFSGCTEQVLPVFGDPEPMIVPAKQPADGPRITGGGSVTPVLSWMERRKSSSTLYFTPFVLGKWGSAVAVVDDENMFVNWADLPSVVSIGNQRLLAHWLSYTADGPYAYQILTAYSDDAGKSWSNPGSPHDDGTPTEHGFVSMAPSEAGTRLIWLDGRNTPDAPMTLRTAVLNSNGDVVDSEELDDRVCDCCQTDIAMTSSGEVAVYRNRTEDEIRDISVARRVEETWAAGVPIANDGWKISGCPVNGPAIAADGDRVVVAWFTAADDRPVVKVAYSSNAGKTFAAPIEIASKKVTGHVDVVIINRDSFAVSWMQSDKQGIYEVNLQARTFDGQAGKVLTVARTSVGRTVPQMVRVDDLLVFAWTDTINELHKVASVKVRIRGFYD